MTDLPPPPRDDRSAVPSTPATEASPQLKLVGGVPVVWAVIGVPVLAIALTGVLVVRRPPTPDRPRSTPVATARLTFEDRADGAVIVRRQRDQARVAVLAPASHAFVRVLLAGLVRERRREGEGNHAIPFTLTRWADGRLTVDDIATHRLIELASFGPNNEASFARLLDAANALGGADAAADGLRAASPAACPAAASAPGCRAAAAVP